MDVCINSKLIGSKQHVIVGPSSNVKLSKHIPSDVWHFNGKIKQKKEKCFDTLLKLEHVSIPFLEENAYGRAFSTLLKNRSTSHVPWRWIMSREHFKQHYERLVSEVSAYAESIDTSYHERVWKQGTKLINALQPAKIDFNKWKAYVESQDGNVKALMGFEPSEEGFAPVPNYDRFSTRTGRLTIKGSKSDILTLKREQRSIFTSRYAREGSIVMIDFSGLEIMVSLFEAGMSLVGDDVYQVFNDNLFNGSMKRKMVKQAVISELYGLSVYSLAENLDVSVNKAKDIALQIKTFLKTKELLARIKAEYAREGFIRNRYGRKVLIDDPRDNIFINSYIQSSGVDVTMLGFNDVVSKIGDRKIIPLLLLHDAMFLDCHNSEISWLESAVAKLHVDGYVQKFRIKLTRV